MELFLRENAPDQTPQFLNAIFVEHLVNVHCDCLGLTHQIGMLQARFPT
jgi:hypothetical protein